MENYTSQVVILRTLEKVVEVFSNHHDFYKWQSHLKSLDFFEGKGLETGAKARLETHYGEQNIVKSTLIVEDNSLPERIKLRYDTGGIISTQTIRFKTLAPLKTLIIIDSEYDKSGLMSVINFMDPKNFKKRSEEFLLNFKAFVEKNH